MSFQLQQTVKGFHAGQMSMQHGARHLDAYGWAAWVQVVVVGSNPLSEADEKDASRIDTPKAFNTFSPDTHPVWKCTPSMDVPESERWCRADESAWYVLLSAYPRQCGSVLFASSIHWESSIVKLA